MIDVGSPRTRLDFSSGDYEGNRVSLGHRNVGMWGLPREEL